MPRGLSSLQKRILTLAVHIREHRTDDWDDLVPDVLRPEIMMHHYGFEPCDTPHPDTTLHPLHLRQWRGHKRSGMFFDVEEVGRAKYNVARAAIARATRRLQARGLVDHDDLYGLRLTPEGWQEAERLTSGQLATS